MTPTEKAIRDRERRSRGKKRDPGEKAANRNKRPATKKAPK